MWSGRWKWVVPDHRPFGAKTRRRSRERPYATVSFGGTLTRRRRASVEVRARALPPPPPSPPPPESYARRTERARQCVHGPTSGRRVCVSRCPRASVRLADGHHPHSGRRRYHRCVTPVRVFTPPVRALHVSPSRRVRTETNPSAPSVRFRGSSEATITLRRRRRCLRQAVWSSSEAVRSGVAAPGTATTGAAAAAASPSPRRPSVVVVRGRDRADAHGVRTTRTTMATGPAGSGCRDAGRVTGTGTGPRGGCSDGGGGNDRDGSTGRRGGSPVAAAGRPS